MKPALSKKPSAAQSLKLREAETALKEAKQKAKLAKEKSSQAKQKLKQAKKLAKEARKSFKKAKQDVAQARRLVRKATKQTATKAAKEPATTLRTPARPSESAGQKPQSGKKRVLTPEGRAKLAALMKARWEARKQGGNAQGQATAEPSQDAQADSNQPDGSPV